MRELTGLAFLILIRTAQAAFDGVRQAAEGGVKMTAVYFWRVAHRYDTEHKDAEPVVEESVVIYDGSGEGGGLN